MFRAREEEEGGREEGRGEEGEGLRRLWEERGKEEEDMTESRWCWCWC